MRRSRPWHRLTTTKLGGFIMHYRYLTAILREDSEESLRPELTSVSIRTDRSIGIQGHENEVER
jgi:hypothetical protein